MFLTDGGTEKPKELFDQHNPNKTVCDFTFFIYCADFCWHLHQTLVDVESTILYYALKHKKLTS